MFGVFIMTDQKNSISITNWENFQHYTDRKMVWIKLYIDLLDNYDYATLDDDLKLLLIHLWLLSPRYKNTIPYDVAFLKSKLPISSKIITETNITMLVSSGYLTTNKLASNMLAKPYQSASLEEKRIEQNRVEHMRILDYFNNACKKKLLLTKDRIETIRSSLAKGRSLEQLEMAIENFSKDTWIDRPKFTDLVYAIGSQRGKPDNFDKWYNIAPVAAKKKGIVINYKEN